MRQGGKILVDQLLIQGCDTIFTVPGESFVSVLDGVYESGNIRAIVCRHEGGASMMADAYGKLTGRPGVCFVARGVGSSHAMSGMHIARQDQTPLIMLVGLVPCGVEDREAWQEIDIKAFFGGVMKWGAVVRDPKRIPEFISRAYQTAMSGRPGPVVLGLPEDVLAQYCETEDGRKVVIGDPAPSPDLLAAAAKAIGNASRPLMIVGGAGWSRDVQQKCESFADAFDLPVVTAWRNQDYFDNRHRCYAGDCHIGMDAKLDHRIRDADVVLIVGNRVDEITTRNYSMIKTPVPDQFLIHVHPDANVVGHITTPDLAVVASPGNFFDGLLALKPAASPRWTQWRAEARQDYIDHIAPQPNAAPINMERVINHVANTLPADAIVSNGAGNYALWIHRYFQFKQYRTQLAPTAGCMGYGLPAAIAAKLVCPEQSVVAFAGDGCFLMTAQEMATAAQYGLQITIIVPNNGIYGSIRMHQERQYPGRVGSTSLTNPDFVAFAKSFGAHAESIERTEDFPAAFERAQKSGRCAVLELKIDPEWLTPSATLSEIREAAEAKTKAKPH